MRFQVELGTEIIGFSELAGGDPPMGVALGRFVATPAYSAVQLYCIEHRNSWVPIPELTVWETSGVPIECSGGVQIIAFSPELGEAAIELHINGITNPPYRELFPDQEKAYRSRSSNSG